VHNGLNFWGSIRVTYSNTLKTPFALPTHHAERLVNPKVLAKKRLPLLDTPEHVDSEKPNQFFFKVSFFTVWDVFHYLPAKRENSLKK
jgi:hypothetical protein